MDSQTRQRAEELLLGAGQLHGIVASKEEIQNALDDADHGPAFAEWAILHLGQDNLLTADEMALYTALDKNGQVDKLAEQHDLADVQAVTEEEVKAAAEEINRSTAAITKQEEKLKLQQDALSRLVQKASDSESRRQDFEASRQQNAETERKFVSAQVEDLSQSLSFRLGDLEQQDSETGTNLSHIIDTVLGSDDKLLASLQKLGYELDQQDPDEAKTIERLRETCLRLIKITVQTIRTKLDRLYLESLVDAERSGDATPATEEEVKALEEEVESLYSELLPVAQMSVEQQYLEPALQSNSSRDGKKLMRSAVAINYINACMDHLLDRCEVLSTTTDTLKSHQVASASVVSAAKAALAASTDAPASRRQQKPTDPGSPVRRASPVRRPPKNTGKSRSARRSSGIIDETPLDTLLQNLAVYLPPEAEADGGRKIRALADVVSDRARKGEDMARAAQESFEEAVAEYLDDVRRAVQMLKDSLMAESPYGRVQLEDVDIRSSLDVLAHEVNKARDGLQRAEASKVTKSQRRDEILQRWGA